MAQRALEKEVAELSRRVSRLERLMQSPRAALNMPAIPGAETVERIFGWFLLTVSSLGLLGHWYAAGSISPLLALLVLFALWLVLRRSSLIGMSDSTFQLVQEGRSQRKLHGRTLHSAAQVGPIPFGEREQNLRIFQLGAVLAGTAMLTFSLTWLVLRYVVNPSAQLVLLLAAAGLAVAYALRVRNWNLFALGIVAVYGLLAFSQAPLLSVAAVCLVAILGVWLAYSLANWSLMLLIVLLSYTVLGRWSTLLQPNVLARYAYLDPYRLGLMVASVLCICLVAFAVPFVLRRRTAADREGVRAVLFANAAGYTVASLWLLDLSLRMGWFATHAVTLIVSAIMGYGAWHTHGRASYAKYFFLISLAATLALAAGQADQSLTATVWLIVAVTLTGAGFLISSHTLRMAGGVVIALVAAHYAFVLVPKAPVGLPLVSDRLWVGCLLAAYLFLLAGWYRNAQLRGSEAVYRSQLVQIGYGVGALAIAGMDGLGASGGVWQSTLWIVAAAICWLAVRKQGYDGVRALGIALLASAFARIVLVDSMALESASRLSVLAGVGALLVLGGFLAFRYPSRTPSHL